MAMITLFPCLGKEVVGVTIAPAIALKKGSSVMASLFLFLSKEVVEATITSTLSLKKERLFYYPMQGFYIYRCTYLTVLLHITFTEPNLK